MAGRIGKRSALLMALVGITGLVALECKKNVVSGVSDDTEIAGYIKHMAPAQDLFRADRLAFNGTWSIPGSGVTFHDSVLSQTRNIVVIKGQTKQYYGVLDSVYEAWATIADHWVVRETRTTDSGSVSKDIPIDLVRYGFFLKLGTDGQEYLGWVLRGYSQSPSVPSTGVGVTALAGTVTPAGSYYHEAQDSLLMAFDAKYVYLEDLAIVTKGARLALEVSREYPPLIAGVSDAGLYSRLMDQVDSTTAVDTVNILGPSSVRAYDYLLLHYVNPSTGLQSPMALLPYRLR